MSYALTPVAHRSYCITYHINHLILCITFFFMMKMVFLKGGILSNLIFLSVHEIQKED